MFGAFSKMIHNMPVQAVLRAIDLECGMLEDDMEQRRLMSEADAHSILCFGRFIRIVKDGEPMRHFKGVPLDHLEFYKETLVRLVNSSQLPASAMEQFESAFSLS
jgi:DnaJ-domain-containing protein 1